MASKAARLAAIAAKFDTFAVKPQTGDLVEAAGRSGALFYEARRLGAFDPIEWDDLDPCFQIYQPNSQAPLNEGRRLFASITARLARRTAAGDLDIRFEPEPPHPGKSYDFAWLRRTFSSLALLMKREAARVSKGSKKRSSFPRPKNIKTSPARSAQHNRNVITAQEKSDEPNLPHSSIVRKLIAKTIRASLTWVLEDRVLEQVENDLRRLSFTPHTRGTLRWMLFDVMRADDRFERRPRVGSSGQFEYRADPNWPAQYADDVRRRIEARRASGNDRVVGPEFSQDVREWLGMLLFECAARYAAIGNRCPTNLEEGWRALHAIFEELDWEPKRYANDEEFHVTPTEEIPSKVVNRLETLLRLIAVRRADEGALPPKEASAITHAVEWLRSSVDRFFALALESAKSDVQRSEQTSLILDEWGLEVDRLIVSTNRSQSMIAACAEMTAALQAFAQFASRYCDGNSEVIRNELATLALAMCDAWRMIERHYEVPAAAAVSSWAPPTGFVGTKKIANSERFRKDGKNPPRTTLQKWAEKSKPPVEWHKDPSNSEVYYPESWVFDRIKQWTPRPVKKA